MPNVQLAQNLGMQALQEGTESIQTVAKFLEAKRQFESDQARLKHNENMAWFDKYLGRLAETNPLGLKGVATDQPGLISMGMQQATGVSADIADAFEGKLADALGTPAEVLNLGYTVSAAGAQGTTLDEVKENIANATANIPVSSSSNMEESAKRQETSQTTYNKATGVRAVPNSPMLTGAPSKQYKENLSAKESDVTRGFQRGVASGVPQGVSGTPIGQPIVGTKNEQAGNVTVQNRPMGGSPDAILANQAKTPAPVINQTTADVRNRLKYVGNDTFKTTVPENPVTIPTKPVNPKKPVSPKEAEVQRAAAKPVDQFFQDSADVMERFLTAQSMGERAQATKALTAMTRDVTGRTLAYFRDDPNGREEIKRRASEILNSPEMMKAIATMQNPVAVYEIDERNRIESEAQSSRLRAALTSEEGEWLKLLKTRAEINGINLDSQKKIIELAAMAAGEEAGLTSASVVSEALSRMDNENMELLKNINDPKNKNNTAALKLWESKYNANKATATSIKNSMIKAAKAQSDPTAKYILESTSIGLVDREIRGWFNRVKGYRIGQDTATLEKIQTKSDIPTATTTKASQDFYNDYSKIGH